MSISWKLIPNQIYPLQRPSEITQQTLTFKGNRTNINKYTSASFNNVRYVLDWAKYNSRESKEFKILTTAIFGKSLFCPCARRGKDNFIVFLFSTKQVRPLISLQMGMERPTSWHLRHKYNSAQVAWNENKNGNWVLGIPNESKKGGLSSYYSCMRISHSK